MPAYRLKLTKTETTVSTYETTMDVPTDDPEKAATYAEIGCSFGEYSGKNTINARWRKGDPVVSVICDAMREYDEVDIPEAPVPPLPIPGI